MDSEQESGNYLDPQRVQETPRDQEDYRREQDPGGKSCP